MFVFRIMTQTHLVSVSATNIRFVYFSNMKNKKEGKRKK
jgi:hypothetical protein